MSLFINTYNSIWNIYIPKASRAEKRGTSVNSDGDTYIPSKSHKQYNYDAKQIRKEKTLDIDIAPKKYQDIVQKELLKQTEEIEEYFSVENTSQRIFDFAAKLVGSDTKKLNDMLEAFKQGYSQVEKLYNGNLPDISKQTYDAVNNLFKQALDD